MASGGHSSSQCAGLSLSRPLLLRSTGSRRAGSVIVAHGPRRSAACGILPDQGSNPCPLHWQADSQSLHHQGSPTVHFLILMVSLGTVIVPVGVLFSLLMCYSEHILRLKVQWKSTCLPSWTHLVLISLCHVLGLCHCFEGCALPPSLLFQDYAPSQQEVVTALVAPFPERFGES